MKKRFILISVLLLLLATFFIPAYQQKTIIIRSSFINVFSLMTTPEKWELWRSDLRNDVAADSSKIAIEKNYDGFSIKYAPLALKVKLSANSFDISEENGEKKLDYNYEFAPVPNKLPAQTIMVVNKKTNVFDYLIGLVSPPALSETHYNELKGYMENGSLLYGFNIVKLRVTHNNLVAIRREVLKKDKFTEAEKMHDELQQYIKLHQLKQMQPLIAQFLTRGTDSTQITVGIFIDKEVASENAITFMHMPKGGPLYTVDFKGQFDKREKAYSALHQYFTDHFLQSAILPFECYLDNKLPKSDTDKVKIRVNFTAYF